MAQPKAGIAVSQRKYVLYILEETLMLDCKFVDTPMDPNVNLLPNQGELYPDPGRYRRLVGKLNYLTMTRPDISFPVSFLIHHVIIIGMSSFGSQDTSKDHLEKGLFTPTKVKLMSWDMLMQIGQVMLMIGDPLQATVFLLEGI